MTSSRDIIILGASARAAAFSALRAGLRPWCADLFADQDLQTRCSNRRVPFGVYPKALEAIAESGPPGPWMYTGGLENHPALILRISAKRVLWGNKGTGLALARRPLFLEEIFQSNGICFPKSFTSSDRLPQTGRWLSKPLRGAGGAGIHFVSSRQDSDSAEHAYSQQFIEGIPCSAVFAGFESDARLLGATRQLVGERWLHARAFHYCGSIGPLKLDPVVKITLEKIGNLVQRYCCLRGLFGVDFILADRIPWPVEINPRYTASVEILEYALGIQALSWHRSAFDRAMPMDALIEGDSVVGKAIMFAQSEMEFPPEGPWTGTLTHSKLVEEMPGFADIPAPGHRVQAGRPILTFFSKSSSVHGCIDSLKQIARDLDHCLWKT